jgi:enoyl-CoA hydratase
MPEPVLVSQDGAVVTVTLNRPERLNALSREMWPRIAGIFRALDADESVRCVVLTGAGDRAFSPGADIAEFDGARASAAQAREYGADIVATLAAISECRHPVVAAVRGVCTGGGLELAIAADIRIATRSARLGIPINRIGVALGAVEFGLLVGLVGRATALSLLLEARIVDGAEAERLGLVTRAVADADFAAEVAAAVARIAEGAPLSNRWHKKFARRLANPAPLARAEIDEAFRLVETEDYREGTRAFLEKRKPRFAGR